MGICRHPVIRDLHTRLCGEQENHQSKESDTLKTDTPADPVEVS